MIKIRILATLTALIMTAALLVAIPSTPAVAIDDLHRRLINDSSGKCLAVQGRRPTGAVIQWPCLPPSQGPDHIWTLAYKGGINYWINNDQTGKCLTASVMHAVQTECDVNNGYQLWTLEGLPYGRYRFHNVGTGKCLAILGGSHADGADAIVWPCGAYADHRWRMGAP